VFALHGLRLNRPIVSSYLHELLQRGLVDCIDLDHGRKGWWSL